jgi:hypothetical protein
MVLKSLGNSRKKRVLVHSQPSFTEVATTAFLECRDRYDAQRCWYFVLVNETCFGRKCRSVHGDSRRGSMLYVRSNSNRTTTSSVRAAMDSFRGLGFARGEGSNDGTHFVQSLKTIPRCLTTPFYWTTWRFTIPRAFGLLLILSGVDLLFILTCSA